MLECHKIHIALIQSFLTTCSVIKMQDMQNKRGLDQGEFFHSPCLKSPFRYAVQWEVYSLYSERF